MKTYSCTNYNAYCLDLGGVILGCISRYLINMPGKFTLDPFSMTTFGFNFFWEFFWVESFIKSFCGLSKTESSYSEQF